MRPGDRLGLIGHNGAGKSTLLRVFVRLLRALERAAPTSHGTVSSLIDMDDGHGSGADRRRQHHPARRVRRACRCKEARRAIPEIAEFSELGPYLHLPMRTYSSGMRMRLAFAISTTRIPDILLFDEMISFGDASFAARAKARVDAMLDKAKILALASHDYRLAPDLLQPRRPARARRLLADGAVEEVWEDYTARLRVSA